MEKLRFNLKAMNIVHYEVGNANKSVPRPVCALMLTDNDEKYKVKVLFKGDKAKSVDKYISSRRNNGTLLEESVYLVGEFREQRKDCIVLDCIDNVYFASFTEV